MKIYLVTPRTSAYSGSIIAFTNKEEADKLIDAHPELICQIRELNASLRGNVYCKGKTIERVPKSIVSICDAICYSNHYCLASNKMEAKKKLLCSTH